MEIKTPSRQDESSQPKSSEAAIEQHTLILPAPEALAELSDEIPEEILAVLKNLSAHTKSDLTELGELIPGHLLARPPLNGLVKLTRPKELEYDEYFSVARTMERPRLHAALALLTALQAAAENALLGHNLEPAAMGDFLKSVRVMAHMLTICPPCNERTTEGDGWPKGKWPTGPW
jgi:hypothetical protein